MLHIILPILFFGFNWMIVWFIQPLEITDVKWLKFDGMVLWPFILYKDKKPTKEIQDHEWTHIAQIAKYGVILFYLIYGIEILYYYFKFRDARKAYESVSFEKQAYKE